MKVLGRILGGITLGYVLATIIGVVLLQSVFFDLGMNILGVGAWGWYYFVGGFIASLFLMFLPGARQRKVLMACYPLAVVIVGFIALSGIIEQDFAPSSDPAQMMLASMKQIAHALAVGAFWITPIGVTAAFACLYKLEADSTAAYQSDEVK